MTSVELGKKKNQDHEHNDGGAAAAVPEGGRDDGFVDEIVLQMIEELLEYWNIKLKKKIKTKNIN